MRWFISGLSKNKGVIIFSLGSASYAANKTTRFTLEGNCSLANNNTNNDKTNIPLITVPLERVRRMVKRGSFQVKECLYSPLERNTLGNKY